MGLDGLIMGEIITEFLGLFIASACGFIIGIAFMAIVISLVVKGVKSKVRYLESKIDRLKEELRHATENRHQDEHPDMG